MSALTIRLSPHKHSRVKELAKSRSVSVNKLFDEWATIAVTQTDAYNRFRIAAARGNPLIGLALLDKLDRSFAAH
jgi:predicted transcriptional regulator